MLYDANNHGVSRETDLPQQSHHLYIPNLLTRKHSLQKWLHKFRCYITGGWALNSKQLDSMGKKKAQTNEKCGCLRERQTEVMIPQAKYCLRWPAARKVWKVPSVSVQGMNGSQHLDFRQLVSRDQMGHFFFVLTHLVCDSFYVVLWK